MAAGLPTTIPTIVWAPDSRRLAIAFARGCGGVEGKGITCASYEVWTARVGSPRAVRVARGRLPAWSADSKRLAVVRYAEKFASDAVFVVPADGGAVRPRGAGGGAGSYLGARGRGGGAAWGEGGGGGGGGGPVQAGGRGGGAGGGGVAAGHGAGGRARGLLASGLNRSGASMSA